MVDWTEFAHYCGVHTVGWASGNGGNCTVVIKWDCEALPGVLFNGILHVLWKGDDIGINSGGGLCEHAVERCVYIHVHTYIFLLSTLFFIAVFLFAFHSEI